MDDICKEIAAAIRNGYFYAGEYSGFSANGEKAVREGLQKFADKLKQEIVVDSDLRDRIAIAVLQGVSASPMAPDEMTREHIARKCYEMADIMLKAREGR